MKYYLVAGEPSGDLHGGRLIRALGALEPGAQFQGWGGDLMQQAGMHLTQHYRDLAFMGVWEVVRNLPSIWRNFKRVKADITAFEPDAVILIDYSGFNLRLAPWLRQQGYAVYYYISPQVWATRPKRVETIRASVDHLFSILPFEKAFYQQYHYDITYVGHPLVDVIEEHPHNADWRKGLELDERPIVALLPGSRRQEVQAVLPVLLSVVEQLPDYQFVVAGAPSLEPELYAALMADHPSVVLARQQTYDLLQHSHAALVTSGTATLETALFGVPQVVCYRGGALLYHLAKRLIRVPYIALVNLIADRPMVPELVQHELTPERLLQALTPLLEGEARAALLEDYQSLREILGPGGAAERAAHYLRERLSRRDAPAPS